MAIFLADIRTKWNLKISLALLSSHQNICCGYSDEADEQYCLNVILSTQTVCFGRRIGKLLQFYTKKMC